MLADVIYSDLQSNQKLDQFTIDSEFIFENLLYRLSESQGKRSGEFLLPVEITKLVVELAAVPSFAKVYNPFAGLASFGSYLQGQEYFGQETTQL